MNLQLDIFQSTQARDLGISQALNHANEVEENWGERCYRELERFLKAYPGEFMAEDVRKVAEENGLPQAPSNRAWGSIIRRAAVDGLIVKVGYGQVRNPLAHRANASVWRKA